MPEYNQEIFRNAIRQLMDIFVTPEVRRRQEIGELPQPLDLRAAQIIFFPDGRRPEVRINSEVKAVGKMKLKTGVSKNPGDPVYENELEGLEELTLTAEDDPNCGHATILRVGNNWILAFDFIYNKALSKNHLETAKQFIEIARFSINHKYWAAFVDSLFSAAELSAKAVLMSVWPHPDFVGSKSHKAIHSKYNRFAHLGNVDPLHAETFNKLSQIRYPARYLDEDFSMSEDEAKDLLETVNSMLEESGRLTKTESAA